MGKYLGYALIYLLQYCFGAVPVYRAPDMEIQECAVKIVQQMELVDATNVALVNVNVPLVKNLHAMLERRVRFISRSFYWPNDTLSNDVYVIQCTNYSTFSHGLDLIKQDPFWNPRAKFVIIIKYIGDALQDVSDFLIKNYVYDVALVASDEVYTFGLERDECDRPVHKTLQLLVSRCSQVHNFQKIYVAARKTYLRGCDVEFVAHYEWPFMAFGYPEPGIEEYILELIAQHEQITVDLTKLDEYAQFGVRLDNFTYTGMLHNIEIGDVEGALGGYILNSNRVTNLDFVYPFMIDYFIIVTARAKMLKNWSAVLKQLGVPTICGVFGTFCVICVIVICMGIFQERVRDNTRDILIIWGYFLNNISHTKDAKTGIPYRLVLLTTLLFVLIVSCATQAYLYSATTEPIRGYQPSTIEEVTSKYELVVSPHAYEYFLNNPNVNLSNVDKFCKVTAMCIIKVSLNGSEPLYTISSFIFKNAYMWEFTDKSGKNELHTIIAPTASIQHTMYLRKGSPLVEPFNRLLLRARSAGLIEKYFDRLVFNDRLAFEYFVPNFSKNERQSLETLKEVYMILISGYCISVIVFVIEISHK